MLFVLVWAINWALLLEIYAFGRSSRVHRTCNMASRRRQWQRCKSTWLSRAAANRVGLRQDAHAAAAIPAENAMRSAKRSGRAGREDPLCVSCRNCIHVPYVAGQVQGEPASSRIVAGMEAGGVTLQTSVGAGFNRCAVL